MKNFLFFLLLFPVICEAEEYIMNEKLTGTISKEVTLWDKLEEVCEPVSVSCDEISIGDLLLKVRNKEKTSNGKTIYMCVDNDNKIYRVTTHETRFNNFVLRVDNGSKSYLLLSNMGN